MKVTGDWLESPATQAVCAAIMREGAQALFVGGCVRNALLQKIETDLKNYHGQRALGGPGDAAAATNSE